MFINSFGEKIISDDVYINNILEINLAGVTNPNPDYRMMQNVIPSKMNYRYYVFEYVLEGKGYIETPEKNYTVYAGDMYFLNKGQYHIYYADHKNPFKKEFIVLRGELADRLAALYQVEDSVIVRQMDIHPIFERIFANIEREDVIPNDELELLIVQLFQQVKKQEPGRKKEKDLAVQIKDYLYDHIRENLTVAKMISDLHISKSVAHRFFAERYGISVMKYYMTIKLDYAKQLIRQTDESIAEIAHYLSFEDEKYFSKCFKKEYGMTPSQFRKYPKLDSTREYKE